MDALSNPVVIWLDNALDYIKKNKKPVFIGVVGATVLITAVTGYWFYRIHAREQAHKTMVQALKYYNGVVGHMTSADKQNMFFSSDAEKWQKTAQVFGQGYEQHKSTALAPMFQAYQAEALLNLGKLGEATELLSHAVDTMKSGVVKDFYRIKLALMKLDSAKELDKQQGLGALKILADDTQSIAHEAALYQLGAYYWNEKKFTDAKSYWQMLLVKYGTRDVKHPSPYAEKVKEKLALLSVENL